MHVRKTGARMVPTYILAPFSLVVLPFFLGLSLVCSRAPRMCGAHIFRLSASHHWIIYLVFLCFQMAHYVLKESLENLLKYFLQLYEDCFFFLWGSLGKENLVIIGVFATHICLLFSTF